MIKSYLYLLTLLAIIMPVQGMDNLRCLAEDNLNSKLSIPKQEEQLVTLVSKDGIQNTINTDLLRFSPVLASYLEHTRANTIQLPINNQELTLIIQALAKLEHLVQFAGLSSRSYLEQIDTLSCQYVFEALLFRLKPLLNVLPLYGVGNIYRHVSRDLDIPVLPYVISSYLKDKPVISCDLLALDKIQAPVIVPIEGTVKLISADNKDFTINRSAAQLSEILKNMISDIPSNEPIPLPNINSKHLAIIINSLDAIASISNTENYANQLAQVLNPLFIVMPFTDVIEVLKAAHFLGIAVLLDYCINLIASQLIYDTNSDRVASFVEQLNDELPADIVSLALELLEQAAYDLVIPLFFVQLKRLADDSGCIYAIAFSPNGRFALIGYGNGTAVLWDVNTGNIIRKLEGYNTTWVKAAAFSPDGKLALIGFYNNTAILWNVNTGDSIQVLEAHKGAISSVAFSPDNTLALTGSEDGTAILWDVNTGKIIHKLIGHIKSVTSVAFSPNGEFALTGSEDGTAILWHVNTGDTIRKFSDNSSPLWSVSFDPSGTLVLAGSDDKTAVLWDVNTGNIVRKLEGHTYSLTSVAVSPNSKFVLTGSWDMARVYNIDTGNVIHELNGHQREITSVAFSPDGKRILTGSLDATAILWGPHVDYKPSIELLVLLYKLNNSATKDTVLANTYFREILEAQPITVQERIKEYFTLQ